MASDRDEALLELRIVTDSLTAARTQLADLESTAHRIRIESWVGSDSEYISARDRMADFNALDLTCDIITLKGEIQADEDRRVLLHAILRWSTD